MIIFLNGCSSSGKTHIAKAMQHLSDKPWLLIGIDTFIQMMPTKYVAFGEKAAEGFRFISEGDEEGPILRIESGLFGEAVTQSMPKVAKILANDSHNLIIDEVIFADQELQNYAQALLGHTTYFVGVMCDLRTLQERELLREDRALGMAREQFSHVHNRSVAYDLTVDTTCTSTFDCAREILSFVSSMSRPRAFEEIQKRYGENRKE